MLNKLPARWYLNALSSKITVLRDQEADAMNAVVIEHVPLAELPKAWRDKLHLAASAQVRVRIEEEDVQQTPFDTSDPAFGIWRDREDMQDVNAYVRKLREPRYGRDGARSLP
jgi:hypothetical protein